MNLLAVHPALQLQSRLRVSAPASLQVWELALLGLCGVAAVLAAEYVKVPVRQVPGKAILVTMLPLALGLSIVPRYGAGTTMSLSAALAVLVLKFGSGLGIGTGAMTSAMLTGVLLDACVWRVRRGPWLYAAMVAAAATSNVVAMLVRGGKKLSGFDELLKRDWQSWSAEAIITYPVCGLVAGVVCAVIFFSLRGASPPAESRP